MALLDTNSLKTRATTALAGFSLGQRAVVVVAVIALVIGGSMFSQWIAKPTMVTLYSNLSSDDAGEITSKLQSANIPYELTNGGSSIMVPQSQVYQTRLDMAADGLPSGGSQGYKLLDKQGITTSEFKQRVDYQRALEGELSKTISSINGVEAAIVHLVIPEDDVFSNDSSKPSASVLVKTSSGTTLGSQHVQSVINLVASSVEGLQPGDVTVADSNTGRVLAAPGNSGAMADDQQRQATQTLEDQLSQKVQSLLEPLVGPGKAVVQARAELNWDKNSETSEIYNETNKQPLIGSEKTTTEDYTNDNPNSTGVLGPDGIPLEENANGASSYKKSDSTVNNLYDRKVTQTENTPGTIQRLSVAVLIDSNVANVDTSQVEALVTQAAGLQPARGDSVAVSRMAFDTSTMESQKKELEEAKKAESSNQMMEMIKTGAGVLIVLIVILILFFITKKGASSYAASPIPYAEIDRAIAALPSAESSNSNALQKAQPGELASAGGYDPLEAIEHAKMDSEITELIEKQPDEVAQLLRSWLADRRS